jgi:hypothetical protein
MTAFALYVDGSGNGMPLSRLYKKTTVPSPVPSPVSKRLLKTLKTSLTVEFESWIITSPANAKNPGGNCRSTFSGIEQTVKLALQLTLSIAHAELAPKATRIKSTATRIKSRFIINSLLNLESF